MEGASLHTHNTRSYQTTKTETGIVFKFREWALFRESAWRVLAFTYTIVSNHRLKQPQFSYQLKVAVAAGIRFTKSL